MTPNPIVFELKVVCVLESPHTQTLEVLPPIPPTRFNRGQVILTRARLLNMPATEQATFNQLNAREIWQRERERARIERVRAAGDTQRRPQCVNFCTIL